MAKILYGIQSEGMGHAIRSRALIDELSKDNEIIVVGSEKVCSYFARSTKVRTSRIQNYCLIYKNNTVSTFRTLFQNFVNMPWNVSSFFRVASIIRKEKPDIIITDFEHVTAYLGFLFRIPVISVDNEHIFCNTDISFDTEDWLDYMKSRISAKIMIPRADKYVVCSFFFPLVRRKNTRLIGPLLRQKILSLKPRYGSHILVYQTSSSSQTLIPVLKSMRHRFIVYGFDREGTEDNVTFKRFNEGVFFKDLAHSKAVIMNGGFTLMSEALYLRKPVLSVPVRHQFEQVLNARYLQKLGYGMFTDDFSKDNISLFVKNLEAFKKNLSHYRLVGNKQAVKEIERFIDSIKNQ